MPRHFALVPAAGSGSRVGGATPKQYLTIEGNPLLFYAVRQLSAHAVISDVFVVLAPDDTYFSTAGAEELSAKIRPLYCGGETRAESVRNGLESIRDLVAKDDWMIVHDAARPCLSIDALERLIREIDTDEVGGLLAIPVADTLKRADGEHRVMTTERREGLWQAQTPQMFRYGVLNEALQLCAPAVTDEAGAIEKLGLKPKLVVGEARNLKVTYPDDLALATIIIRSDESRTVRR